MPALELDDGEILSENVAILSFIAAQSDTLIPPEGIAHWRVLETTAFVATELHRSFTAFFTPESSGDDQANAKETLTTRFGYLEYCVGDRGFILGGDITIPDCYLLVMLMWGGEKAGLTLPPRLSAYYERLKARPGIVRALHEGG